MSKTIAGALVGNALGAFGDIDILKQFLNKPFTPVDPSKIQQETAAGNLAVLPEASALGKAVNATNADQMAAILDRLYPGQRDKVNQIVMANLRGEVGSDVASQVDASTNALAMNLGVGGGSQFRVGLTGGRLLQTSQQIQQRGLAQYNINQANAPRPFDVTSMFFTPQQRLQFAVADRAAQFSHDLLAAQVNAAPNPADVALAEGFDNFFEQWKNVGMGMLGGAMGGGGGGMGGMMGGMGGGGSGGGGGGGSGGGQSGFYGGGGVSGNEVFVGNPTLSDYYGGWK